MNSDVTLTSGSYDFQVLGSGIVLNAYIYIDGTPVPVSVDANSGSILHQAVNYHAVDVPIGRTSTSFSSTGTKSKLNAACKIENLAGASGTHTVSAAIFGVIERSTKDQLFRLFLSCL
ncbi:MAG: hypothetical protein H7318_20590 [Oligoflexus sp.]|nr:hypothetical protein [Oligoflexus sp.]